MKMTKRIMLAVLMLAITVLIPSILPLHHVFGKMIQPMHTPVLLAAYIVGGPLAMVVGAVAPLLRHAMVGLPEMTVAVPMCFELATYGLVAGAVYKLSSHRGRSIVKSLIAAMIAGRIVWGIASYFVQSSLGNQFTFGMFMTEAFFNAIPGIVIQLFVVSLIIYGLKKTQKEKIKK